MAKSRMGRGLDKLISNNLDARMDDEAGLSDDKRGGAEKLVRLADIEPNRGQPRNRFDEEAIAQLADSIKLHGIIQPIVVRQTGSTYEIIAGERRWRAARLAGLTEVPVLIRDYSEQEAYEVALIENIQRQSLNSIEEAVAYKKLIDDFGLKQEEVAERISKSRTAVTNSLRLLKLSDEVKQMVIDGEISGGHARSLLGIKKADKQLETAQKIVKNDLSVRETEALVKAMNEPAAGKEEKKREELFRENKADLGHIEEALKAALGTKVSIQSRSGDKGSIRIEYYSKEELDRIIAQLGARL